MFTRVTKASVALFTGALLLLGGGMVAQAAPADAVIDPALNGNIHLVKYDDAAGVTDPNGTNTPPTGANPIPGIEFTLSKVEQSAAGVAIDLTTNEGRKAAAALDAAAVAADKTTYGVVEKNVSATGTNGEIDWTDLEKGVYLLEETNSKVGEITYRAAAPSLVFLPTTNPADQSSWLKEADGSAYAVWVFPKNSLESNLKTVDDKNKQVGETITYMVESSIPAVRMVEGKYNLKDFAFYDTLDPKLNLEGTDSVVVKVGTEVLTVNDDYQVQLLPAQAVGESQQLYVYVTDAGLQKLAAAKAADSTVKASLSFSPKVKESGVIANQVQVYKNAGDGKGKTTPPDGNPPTPPEGTENSNITVSAWGKITVNKKNEADQPLPGAEFQVFDKADTAFANPIAVAGETTFTTGKDGSVVIDGLHVNDYANDSVTIGDQVAEYVLVETKAPAGYELIGQPIPFKIVINDIAKIKTKTDAGGQVVDRTIEEISLNTNNADANLGTTLELAKDVVNIPVKPKLPFTGGMGVFLFGIIGVAVIGAGAYMVKRNSHSNA